MRLIRRAEFLTMPPGTFYCACDRQWVFENLCIKRDTCGNDWWYTPLDTPENEGTDDWIDGLDEMLAGSTRPVEQDWSRDGGFNPETLFLVYERADLEVLAGYVKEAIAATETTP